MKQIVPSLALALALASGVAAQAQDLSPNPLARGKNDFRQCNNHFILNPIERCENTNPPLTGSSRTLPIAPLYQEDPGACWVALASMIFGYYGLPSRYAGGDYQCDVVMVMFPQCICGQCVPAIGTMDGVQFVIDNYGYAIAERNLSSSITSNALTFDQVAREIDSDRPIIAGVSPSGFAFQNVSMHVVVIAGYETNGAVPPRLVVNDPYPYAAPAFGGQANPYLLAGGQMLQPGQYSVPYSGFVNQLHWESTLYEIQ